MGEFNGHDAEGREIRFRSNRVTNEEWTFDTSVKRNGSKHYDMLFMNLSRETLMEIFVVIAESLSQTETAAQRLDREG